MRAVRNVRNTALVSVIFVALLGGCGGDTITLEMSFPSRETFVRVDTVQVFAIPITEDQRGDCPTFLMQAEAGTLNESDLDSGSQPVCDLLGMGGLELPAAPSGLHAYVAVARSNGAAYLSGCTTHDLAGEASSEVRFDLAITNRYRAEFPAGSPAPTCSVDDKCMRGCREP